MSDQADSAVKALLDLREVLVRYDENAKAYTLLTECVPYHLREHPDVIRARGDQAAMTAHLRDHRAYEDYYAHNPHERPFEEQYGIEVAQAHRLPRIAFLRAALAQMYARAKRELRVLDLGANDGFMGANLTSLGFVTTDCVDLHPGNCELARSRKELGAAIGYVIQGEAIEVVNDLGLQYDAVVAFELIEHVPSPRDLLESMAMAAEPGGRLFVSTPNGAVERGNLPEWDHVECKGHVRSMTYEDLRAVCELVGEIETLTVGVDNVTVAQVRVS